MEFWAVSILPVNNPQICSLAIADNDSFAGFAVVSIEYSLCNFRHLAYFRSTIHRYAHLPSPDAVSDRVCRWLD